MLEALGKNGKSRVKRKTNKKVMGVGGGKKILNGIRTRR